VDRCALFVDAGYALADGAMVVHGTRRRDSVSWNHSGLLTLLAGLAKDRTGLPVLRCYWYEVAADGRRTPEQDALAEMPGLKLRLVNSRPGRREGIDSQMRRDLVTLAKSGAISDAFIASADDHLAEIVAEVQDLGLRVVVLHISSDGAWTIPQQLRQECDDIVEISGVHLRPFVELIRGAEPAMAIEAYPGPAEARAAGEMAQLTGGAHQRIPAEHAGSAAVPAHSSAASAYAASAYPAVVPGSVMPGPPVNSSIPAAPAAAVPASASPESARAGYSEPGGLVPGVGPLREAPQQSQSQTLPYDRAQHYPAAASPPSPAPAATSYANGFDGPGADPLGPATRYGGTGPAPATGMPPAEQGWSAIPGDAGAYRGGDQNGALPHPSPANGAYPASGSYNGTGQNGSARLGPAPNGPTYAGPAQGGPAMNGVQNLPGMGGGGIQNGPGMNGGPLNGTPGTGGLNWGTGPASQQPPAARYEAPPGYPQQGAPGSAQAAHAGFGAAQAQPGPPPPHAHPQPTPQPPHAQQGPGSQHPQLQPGPPPLAQVQPTSPQHGPPSQPGQGLVYQDHYAAAQQSLAQQAPSRPMQPALALPDAVKAAHAEGFSFGESVGRDAPGLWLEAVLARKPRMPSDLEARLLQGSALPIDSLLHDEVRHSLRRGFWDALEGARR
jgi:hypothetical protein